MTVKNRFKFRAVTLMFAVVILFSAMQFISYAATDTLTEVKIVRLGYFDFENYMIGDNEDAEKSGYAYELLCNIATINNWRYEFVYGDFNDLYVDLLKGKIDILPCLVYSEERAQKHLFSDEEIYEENYFVSALKDKVSKPVEISDLDGKKLSTVTDCYQNIVFEEWAKQNGISMEFVFADSFDDSWKLLDEGKADYILNIDSAALKSGYKTLFEVGSRSSHFAVAPGREDILEQMNGAIKKIYEINPFTITHLREKYFTGTLSSFNLSEDEIKWLDGRDVIKVAGLKNEIPYTYTDSDGNITGVYPDVLESVFSLLGVNKKVEWILYDTVTGMHNALLEGVVDLVCPDYKYNYYAQTNGMVISEEIQSVNMGILFDDAMHERDIKKIATPRDKLGIYYVEENYPDAEILDCYTVEECVDAVAKGKADAAVAHITAIQENSVKHLKNFQIKALVTGCPICFSATPENGMIICIINRGLHLISDSELQELELYHSPERNFEFWNFVKNNKLAVAMIMLALVLIIVYSVERQISSLKLKKNLAEITKQNEIIEASRRELTAAKEDAQAASKAKSTFLFNMSHDIRTPMNAIIGFNNMAINHIDEKERVSDCLNKINISSRHLLSLINDVLDMARIESGKVKCEYEVTDIIKSEGELIDIIKESMQKTLNIETDFSEVEHRTVLADRIHIDRILTNVISNSVKYTPDGGSIKYTIKEMPAVNDGYRSYDFIVEDTGIGMSEEFLAHIFEEFSREKSSTMSGVQGTGLGMAITKRLIDILGGTIDIKSKLGEGTQTVIHIDMKTAEIDGDGELSSATGIDYSILEGKKILLVEDNELNREIATDILAENGMTIDTAEDGDIAVEKMRNAQAGQYDLILMDIQMPRMNGYDATRAIRSLPDKEISSIPIVAMTANAFEEDRQNALDAGMNGHTAKPIDVDNLIKLLFEILKK